MKLFVYGTLMRGEPFHHLLGEVRRVGAARTVAGFALVDFQGAYPGMVREGHGRVTGEVYEIDVARLAQMDAYEDCPGMYLRETIALDDGSQAVAYVLRTELAAGRARIPGGDWRQRPR